MFMAILTKYLGPTTTRGSRIVATAGNHRIVVPYEYGNDCQHTKAAHMLAENLGWMGNWFKGDLLDGRSVFVRTTDNVTNFAFEIEGVQS